VEVIWTVQEVLHFLLEYTAGAIVPRNWIVKIRAWHGRNIIQTPVGRKRSFGNISAASNAYLLPKGTVPLPKRAVPLPCPLRAGKLLTCPKGGIYLTPG